MKYLIFTATLLVITAGCQSTRITLDPHFNVEARPSYEDYFDYFFWGLKGKREINLDKVCVDQKPLGFFIGKRADDIVISIVSLGIYTPTTVRIWCGGDHD